MFQVCPSLFICLCICIFVGIRIADIISFHKIYSLKGTWGLGAVLQAYSSSMNSGKIVADGTGGRESEVLQEVLADLKMRVPFLGQKRDNLPSWLNRWWFCLVFLQHIFPSFSLLLFLLLLCCQICCILLPSFTSRHLPISMHRPEYTEYKYTATLYTSTKKLRANAIRKEYIDYKYNAWHQNI